MPWLVKKNHFLWWLCHSFMALTFDSASEFTQYDWENVSSTDWQDCFEEMVSLSRDGNSSNSSSLSTSTTIGDDVIDKSSFIMSCSKHRYNYSPPPTPPGYWDVSKRLYYICNYEN